MVSMKRDPAPSFADHLTRSRGGHTPELSTILPQLIHRFEPEFKGLNVKFARVRGCNANGFCASSIVKGKGHARNAKSAQEGGALCALKGAPFPFMGYAFRRRSISVLSCYVIPIEFSIPSHEWLHKKC